MSGKIKCTQITHSTKPQASYARFVISITPAKGLDFLVPLLSYRKIQGHTGFRDSRPDAKSVLKRALLQRTVARFSFKELVMANHPSALKRMRQNEKKRLRNMSYRSKVKTAIKKYLQAAQDKHPEAGDLLRQATSLLHKGVSKGIFHKNTAGRTVSRLSQKISAA
jgi:small subunit ribosomal protein S20